MFTRQEGKGGHSLQYIVENSMPFLTVEKVIKSLWKPWYLAPTFYGNFILIN